jgi:hypothetical protein
VVLLTLLSAFFPSYEVVARVGDSSLYRVVSADGAEGTLPAVLPDFLRTIMDAACSKFNGGAAVDPSLSPVWGTLVGDGVVCSDWVSKVSQVPSRSRILALGLTEPRPSASSVTSLYVVATHSCSSRLPPRFPLQFYCRLANCRWLVIMNVQGMHSLDQAMSSPGQRRQPLQPLML